MEAFGAFETTRLAELGALGIDAEVATAVLLDEWQQMDAASRARWNPKEGTSLGDSLTASVELDDLPIAKSIETQDFELIDEDDLALASLADPAGQKTAADRNSSKAKNSSKSANHESFEGVPSKQSSRQSKASSGDPGSQRPRKRKAGAVEDVTAQASVSVRSALPRQAIWEALVPEAGTWVQLNAGQPGTLGDDALLGDASSGDDREEASGEKGPEKQCAFRASRAISAGALHPDWLTEPAAVAQISLPTLPADLVLRLPERVISEGLLSSPQLESVAYAARRFNAMLPNGMRCGYYLGDGTGCGKGRVISSLAWHLWNSGAKRHVWLSANADLLADAKRDFSDIGADLPISSLSKWGYGQISGGRGLDANGDGIMFVSYALLVSAKSASDGALSAENSRLRQLIDWLRSGRGGACGLIALDEAHRAKNVGSGLKDGQGMYGSKTGVLTLELQRECPGAAVLYASATGATEIRHLGYLERLGLWGPGRPHASFEELHEAVENGGLAAMELIAMTMRAEGMLSCRALSFKGTAFRLVDVSLGTDLLAKYTAACKFWQEAFKLIVVIMKAKKLANRKARVKNIADDTNTMTMRFFWAYQQQFYRQFLVCAKVDKVVDLAEAARIRDEAVVISMWSTGESITQQRAQREGSDGGLGSFASAPEEIARRLLKKLVEPLLVGQQPSVIACFRKLEHMLSELKLPANPLDDLIERLGGPRAVAELTGRSRRPVRVGKEVHMEDRGEDCNLEEQRAFQSGQKCVAIITEAASAGISLHSDRRLPPAARRPRYMISIELPWEADKAVQQFGRVHRSNQAVPPKFAVVVTDLGGEVRFVSAVARRLRILGAMMRGDRNSAHGAVQSLVTFDVQNRYGRRALARFFELLRTKGEPEVSFSFIGSRPKGRGKLNWSSWTRFCDDAMSALEMIGLRPDTDDKFDDTVNQSRNLNVYMNRLLMLEPGIQNVLFDAVAELYAHLVALDRADGSFDNGLESLDRQGRRKASVSVAHKEVLYKDPETGAETTYVRLRIDRGISWPAAKQTFENDCDGDPEGFYWRQKGAQREVVLAVARPLLRGARGPGEDEDDEDDEDKQYDLYHPEGIAARHASRSVTRETLRGSSFRRTRDAERAEVEQTWKALHAAGADSRFADEHVLSGSILNTWAVVGSAVSYVPGSHSSKRGDKSTRKIPLVRAQLAGGGSVVGVRVRPGCLQEVRYALQSLLEQSQAERAGVPKMLKASPAEDHATEEVEPPDVESLSEHLEACLKKMPGQSAVWHGWAGAHKALVADGLVDSGARGMLAAQEAMEGLDRNGKLDIDDSTGVVHLREKQKGSGWYIPPPKKPKTSSRGRGRGRGRGRAAAAF